MSKMLIVDDEEKIRAVVREYAEFEEFEVTEAPEAERCSHYHAVRPRRGIRQAVRF